MSLVIFLLAGGPVEPSRAQGHGPVYGLSTPTLGRGGWSLDVAVMGRWNGEGRSAAMLRPMLSYGVTEDLQLSASAPIALNSASGLRPARGTTRMPASRDAEALLAWRFHRQAPAVGSRFESTAYLGLDWPTDDVRAGIETGPGLYGAAVTGYVSRTVYAWVGGLYRKSIEGAGANGDRAGDRVMYSLVLGYRPAAFRRDLPHPDWRIFLEAVGEYAWPDVVEGREGRGTGGHEIFVGPTLLGLFGAWGISGGPAFPVYRDLEGASGDRLRLIVNTTLWF